jgi:hypothetical protein
MPKKRPQFARLNIYLHDSAIRRQVKVTAASQDLSVSEYCVRAITSQLVKDGERARDGGPGNVLGPAVKRARRFQAEKFGNRAFSVSSAQLIREARERNAR